MTLDQYNQINKFPFVFKSITDYHSDDFLISAGETFIGVRKETLGRDDHSIIDLHGHPHHYSGVEVPNERKMANQIEKEKLINNLTVFRN